MRLFMALLLTASSICAAADLDAAAQLAGMSIGMATECKVSPAPIWTELNALMDRSKATEAQRRQVREATTNASALGAATQQHMKSCDNIPGRIARTVDALKNAR